MLAEAAAKHGGILQVSEEEKRRNIELVKKLIRSLYLVKYCMSHNYLHWPYHSPDWQWKRAYEHLKSHKIECAGNASCMSKISTAEFLNSISHFIEQGVFCPAWRRANFYSIIADESTDVCWKEEMSICSRWVKEGKVMDHFLGIVRANEVYAQCLT